MRWEFVCAHWRSAAALILFVFGLQMVFGWIQLPRHNFRLCLFLLKTESFLSEPSDGLIPDDFQLVVLSR